MRAFSIFGDKHLNNSESISDTAPDIIDRYRLVFERKISSHKSTPIKEIIDRVADKYGMSAMDIISPRRGAVVKARHEAMWRAKHETTRSLPEIGRVFNKDHTTVIYGIAQHEKRIASEASSGDAQTNTRSCITKTAPLAHVQNIGINNTHSP